MTKVFMSEPKLIKARIADFIPDDKNANQGTDRGEVMLQTSIAKFGAGRSILIDKNNRIIGGNKTWSKADLEGLQDAIIVETDGKQLVAVKRTDIDLDTPVGREMAIADNRTGQVNLNWDYEILGELSEDVDLGDWFTEEEMERWDVEDSGYDDDGTEYQPPEDQSFEGDDIPESTVRMVQLFLDTETQPLFLEMVENLNLLYGTDNPTDCVMAGLRELCQNHAIVLENG